MKTRHHLDAGQIRFFLGNGYLEYGRVLEDDAIRELRAMIDDFATAKDPKLDLGTDRRSSYTLFTPVFSRRPRYGDLILRNPMVLDIVESLIGPTFRLLEDQMFYKPARHGAALPYHADNIYYGFKEPRIVTCWIALDECVPENGCLKILPGSHRQAVEHVAVGETILKRALIDESKVIEVPARTGDLIVFDGLTVHGSGPNLTDKPRRVANMVAIVPTEDGTVRKFDAHGNPFLRGGPPN